MPVPQIFNPASSPTCSRSSHSRLSRCSQEHRAGNGTLGGTPTEWTGCCPSSSRTTRFMTQVRILAYARQVEIMGAVSNSLVFQRPLFLANFSTSLGYHVQSIFTHLDKTPFLLWTWCSGARRLSSMILDESERGAFMLPKHPSAQTFKSEKKKKKFHLGQSAVVWSVEIHKHQCDFVLSREDKSHSVSEGHGDSGIRNIQGQRGPGN